MKPFCIPDASALRKIRLLAGLSKVEVAERGGWSTETLRRWENGDYYPRTTDARKLLRIYEDEFDRELRTELTPKIAHNGESRGVDE